MKYDTDISIPKVAIPGRAKGRLRLLIEGCPVGASFFEPLGSRQAIHNHVSITAKALGPDAKFCTRTVTENGVNGVRIWRLS